jgi:hypothetical protein
VSWRLFPGEPREEPEVEDAQQYEGEEESKVPSLVSKKLFSKISITIIYSL